jgi:hypothetical protein
MRSIGDVHRCLAITAKQEQSSMPTKKPDRTTIDALEPGFYVLAQDVENPKPDRRTRRSVRGKRTLPKGLRVEVRLVQRRDWQSGDWLNVKVALEYGGDELQPDLADAVASHLVPAEPAVGQLIDEYHPAAAILAQQVDQGKITLEDIRATHPALEPLNWLWRDNHWIDVESKC